MTLLNFKDMKVQFSQNVLYLMKDEFMQKTVNHKKKISWVFIERVTFYNSNSVILILSFLEKIEKQKYPSDRQHLFLTASCVCE